MTLADSSNLPGKITRDAPFEVSHGIPKDRDTGTVSNKVTALGGYSFSEFGYVVSDVFNLIIGNKIS